MRFFRGLFACLVLCTLAGSARATRINILDPFTTNGIYRSPFTVGFSACTSDELPPGSSGNPLGCFAGVNYTGDSWTGIDLVLHDPTASFNFECNTEGARFQIFTSSSCGFDPTTGDYNLFFSAGTLPQNGFFVITEDDLPPGALTFTATVVTSSSATPEPSSLLLLSTGLFGVGYMIFTRRRATTA